LDAKESLASEKLESMVINQQEAEKRREGTKVQFQSSSEF